ncbi:hypothetical protein BCR39DRAFT_545379 [Naematelia encephala]|uniref:RING-type domain-containing protein n=1 Tax=Naematelia encephala TaxID=71784 RepID=A0A1Y2AR80_9TREE|nr:hypothetical protein BCR39DRAFT_545379 [Naematelia encephala]
MPLPSLHPLPVNPTTGQIPLASLGSRSLAGPPPASASGGGGVSREVLKGLQDVVWSDDEDDPDCIVCAEPLDLSDLNFKPCQCGIQICQFCYNRLLQSDGRCPGCRRQYDAKAVVFQPVDFEEVKRAKDQKTRRAKTIKQLDAIGRRHLLSVRIVMKNMVYVVGMKLPALGDDAIPILRGNDYFGQYGKISKLYLRDRSALPSSTVHTLNSDNSSTSTGVYIVYVRREDAARAISALDGIPAPAGPPGTILRATYGTTRYCDSFLRGQKCDNVNCQNAHEWGGESDCFTKDDMETALTRPQEYDARQKQAHTSLPSLIQKPSWSKPSADEVAPGGPVLPSSAAWAKPTPGRATPIRAPTAIARPAKISIAPLNGDHSAFPLPTPSPVVPPPLKSERSKRKIAADGTTMSRGKSSDSTQSGTLSSSNQTSPKKKPSNLPAVVTTKVLLPNAPPPPASNLPVNGTKAARRSSIEADETADESISADSEAGPSSASPAPQTPSRADLPPPPLTSDPIFVHSPYEEPRILTYPLSDPEFAFVLDLEEADVRRLRSNMPEYQPTPFSKTLVGLAELGILSPELPDFATPPPRKAPTRMFNFQPFDAKDADESFTSNATAGPSGAMEVENEEGPRTTSRFDFARPSSTSTGRGQSPFAVMRNRLEDSAQLNGWPGRPLLGLSEDAIRGQADNRSSVLAQQVASFVGSYGSSSANENGWTGESPFMPSMQPRQAGYGQDRDRRGDQMNAFGYGGRTSRAERDEYDPAMMQYNHTPSQAVQRNLFSPESASHHEDALFSSPQVYPNMLSQQQQQQQQNHPTPPGFPDARSLQQYHQARAPSPTPLSGHGYRRY